jgi:hypothetical protein
VLFCIDPCCDVRSIDELILKAGSEIEIKNAAGEVSFCRVRVYNPH